MTGSTTDERRAAWHRAVELRHAINERVSPPPMAWSADGREFGFRCAVDHGIVPGDFVTLTTPDGVVRLGQLRSKRVDETDGSQVTVDPAMFAAATGEAPEPGGAAVSSFSVPVRLRTASGDGEVLGLLTPGGTRRARTDRTVRRGADRAGAGRRGVRPARAHGRGSLHHGGRSDHRGGRTSAGAHPDDGLQPAHVRLRPERQRQDVLARGDPRAPHHPDGVADRRARPERRLRPAGRAAPGRRGRSHPAGCRPPTRSPRCSVGATRP